MSAKDPLRDSWQPESPETELMWELGSKYPTSIIVTFYETNCLGERRFIESINLKIEKPCS